MYIVLRVLVAVILSQVVSFISLWLWSSVPLWWVAKTVKDPVVMDTAVLSIHMAANHLSSVAQVLSLLPVVLACLISSYSIRQRFKAWVAGFLATQILLFGWQVLLSLISGHSVAVRYAKISEPGFGDMLGVAVVCILSVLVTLHFIPLRKK